MKYLVLSAAVLLVLASSFASADSARPKILLVEDAHLQYNNSVTESYYTGPLNYLGYAYLGNCAGSQTGGCYYTFVNNYPAGDGPSSQTMSGYDIVIWFTGRDYYGTGDIALTSNDRSNIASYLSGGSGSVFLTGEAVAFDAFQQNAKNFTIGYFNASWYAYFSNPLAVTGTSNDAIGSGISNVNITNGLYPQAPDIVDPSLTYNSVFYPTTYCKSGSDCRTNPPGIVKSNTSVWKTVFSSFAFEGIVDTGTRNTLLNRIINYLTPPATRYTTATGTSGVQNLTNSTIYLNATCRENQLSPPGSITAAEFFIDSVPSFWQGGSGTAMTSTYGVFGYSFQVNVTGSKVTSDLTESNHTAYVHCKNSDNKWGKFDMVNFTVDRTPPGYPNIFIERQANGSTNQVKPVLDLSWGSGSRPDYFALSCNGAAYTEWIPWASTYTNFDMTNSTVGCPGTDGTRTVYIIARDATGNINPTSGSNSVNLDRINPKTLSISPANYSFANSNTNITIQISDENSGIKNSTYNNGTVTSSFSNNVPFSQVWPSEGVQTLRVDVYDNAGNLNESMYTFKVDNTPPSTSDNSSGIVGWKSSNQTVGLTCTDTVGSGSSGATPSGCNATVYCVGASSCTPNVTSYPLGQTTPQTSVPVTCSSGSCQLYVRYYSVDNASNAEPIKNSSAIKIDVAAPAVSINSPLSAWYKGTITINSTVADNDSGVSMVFFNMSNPTWPGSLNPMTLSGGYYIGTFDTAALRDDSYNLTIYANDTVGNVNKNQYVNVSIDNTPPTTTADNFTTNWNGTDQTVRLTCNDNGGSGCNTILYCVDTSGTCTPNITYSSPFPVTCQSGNTCTKFIVYMSNDTLNNVENIKSNTTKIDKQAPNVTLQNPLNSTYSGVVQIQVATSDDPGSGVNMTWYDIRNITNTSQVMKSGFLNASNGWKDTWNSSSVNGTFVFNVSSNDTVGNLNYNTNLIFTINNTKPTITIVFPRSTYRNSTNFNLDIRVQTGGNYNISNASWYISNSTWYTNNSNNSINAKSFNFTDSIDVSTLSDGNYTLNATANDTANSRAADVTWFVVDKTAPATTDNSNPSSPWSGSDQSVSLSCTDSGTYPSGCHRTSYCINTTASCPSFSVGTPNPTVSVSCALGSTCVQSLIYKSNDTAGNTEGNKTSSAIRIDKQAPVTNDSADGAWHGSDQTMTLACADNGGSGCNTTMYCTGSQTCTPNTKYSSPFSVSCPSGSTCTNYTVYWSNDTVGNFETAKPSKQILIDKQNPSVSIYAPSNGVLVNGMININATVTDGGSGVSNNNVFYNSTFNSSLTPMTLVSSGSYGGTLNTITMPDGAYNISVYANDTVGNVNSSQYVTITVDNTPPVPGNYSFDASQDPTFGDYRIYTQGSIIFYANVTDATNVSKVIASINGVNSTMVLLSGSLNSGVWYVSYTNTTGLGTYTVSNLYANDTLGNSRTISQGTMGKNFTVVNATVGVLIGGTNSIGASDTQGLSINFSFNKTVASPNVMMFIPPNTLSNFAQAPNYANASAYVCSFGSGCTVVFSNDSSGKITLVNITGIGNGTTLNITANQTVHTVPQDSTGTWVARFNSVDYTGTTRIKVPYLNISMVACNGGTTCMVNQDANFTLNVTVANVNQSTTNGKAFAVAVGYSNQDTGLNSTFALGDMQSNSSYNASWTVNVTRAGNFTFSIIAYDRTLQYNATAESVYINVTDTQPPSVSSGAIDSNVVNINGSVGLTVSASDNTNVSTILASIRDNSSYTRNYTMSLLSGDTSSGAWNLSYYNTTSTGTYSITGIYANDTAGNSVAYLPNISFTVVSLNVTEALSNTNLALSSGLTIYANVTGNATAVGSVMATIAKPRSFTEIVTLSYNQTPVAGVYQYVGAYSNTTRSGNYSVVVNATAGSSVNDSRQFSVSFGNVTASSPNSMNITNSTGARNITVFVFPVGGDLVNITGYLNISNQSVANITSAESFAKVLGNLTYEDNSTGFLEYWTINESNLGVTNFTFVFNSSFNNVSYNKSMAVTVVQTDTVPPAINAVNATYGKVNLFDTYEVTANVTDNTLVDNVSVEIAYPDGGRQNITMAQTGVSEYSLAFSNTSETGNYSYRIIAFDTSGNSNNSTWTNFTAYNNYTVVVIPEHDKYNKGENISIAVQVLDANGRNISTFNLTVILDRGGSNTTLASDQTGRAYYVIDSGDNPVSGDTPSTYAVYAIVNRSGNIGSNQSSVSVYKVLVTKFVSLADGAYSDVGSVVPLGITVTNERGETVTDARVSVACTSCSNQFATLVYDSDRGYYYNPAAFVAPSTSYQKFSLAPYATDFYKNDQGDVASGTIFLTTERNLLGGPGPGGVSGGGGGSGGSSGIFGEPSSNQTSGPVRSFDFTLAGRMELARGDNGTLLGTLSNKGNVRIDIESSVSKQCCDVAVQNGFSLSAGQSKTVEVGLHVPLYARAGEYITKISMTSSGLVKEQSFDLIVKDSQYIVELDNANSSLAQLDSGIADLRAAGADTGKLDALRSSLAASIARGYKAIENDDLGGLSSLAAESKGYSGQLFNDMAGMQLLKFLLLNRVNIAMMSVFALGMIYTVTQIWMPYYSLRNEITRLKQDEKSLVASRVEAEKQYFLRKINEQTFFTIMSQKQGEILKLRGRLDTRNKELAGFVMNKLHPFAFVFWLRAGGGMVLDMPAKIRGRLTGIKVDFNKPEVYMKAGHLAKAAESAMLALRAVPVPSVPRPRMLIVMDYNVKWYASKLKSDFYKANLRLSEKVSSVQGKINIACNEIRFKAKRLFGWLTG